MGVNGFRPDISGSNYAESIHTLLGLASNPFRLPPQLGPIDTLPGPQQYPTVRLLRPTHIPLNPCSDLDEIPALCINSPYLMPTFGLHSLDLLHLLVGQQNLGIPSGLVLAWVREQRLDQVGLG